MDNRFTEIRSVNKGLFMMDTNFKCNTTFELPSSERREHKSDLFFLIPTSLKLAMIYKWENNRMQGIEKEL